MENRGFALPRRLRPWKQKKAATCLVLLPPSFVVHSLQIAADMRLVHASLGGKIPAASCYLYLLPPPKPLPAADGATQACFISF
jgi:hypothetical protein